MQTARAACRNLVVSAAVLLSVLVSTSAPCVEHVYFKLRDGTVVSMPQTLARTHFQFVDDFMTDRSCHTKRDAILFSFGLNRDQFDLMTRYLASGVLTGEHCHLRNVFYLVLAAQFLEIRGQERGDMVERLLDTAARETLKHPYIPTVLTYEHVRYFVECAAVIADVPVGHALVGDVVADLVARMAIWHFRGRCEARAVAQDVPSSIFKCGMDGGIWGHMSSEWFSNISTDGITSAVFTSNRIEALRRQAFAAFKDLSQLSLDNNRISAIEDDAFDGLSSLRSLFLHTNCISSITASTFKGLPALTVLFLFDNRIEVVEERAFQALPLLTTLLLGRNRIASVQDGVFDGLPSLRSLDLSKNQITTIEWGAFLRLPTLVDLDLGDNDLEFIDEGHFGRMSSLTDLRLANNRIEFIKPGAFSELSALERLDLSGNRIHTIEWGALLYGLSSLSQLLLKGNPICGQLPAGTLKSLVFRAAGKPSRMSGIPAGVDVQC